MSLCVSLIEDIRTGFYILKDTRIGFYILEVTRTSFDILEDTRTGFYCRGHQNWFLYLRGHQSWFWCLRGHQNQFLYVRGHQNQVLYLRTSEWDLKVYRVSWGLIFCAMVSLRISTIKIFAAVTCMEERLGMKYKWKDREILPGNWHVTNLCN